MELDNKIIARIKKMLALASDSGATEGERDNALRMAHAYLAKYNLDIATVEQSTKKQNNDEPRVETARKFYGRAPWARQVASGIGKMMFCYYFYTTDRHDRSNVSHWFIGRHSNSVSASILAEFIVKSVISQAKKGAATSFDIDYARTFCVGAAGRIAARCEEIVAHATKKETAAPGTALVLANLYSSEMEANKQMTLKHKLVVKQSRTKALYSSEAYEAGRKYGNSVSLNQSIGKD